MPRFPLVPVAALAAAFAVAAALALRAQTQAQPQAQTPGARPAPLTLYIGTYSKTPGGGICAATFDAQTGQLSAPRVAAAMPDPSWIARSRDGRTLYALSEGASGGLSAFAVGPDGALHQINAQPSGGGLAHLSVDKSGHWLVAAAYNAATVTLFPIEENGALGAPKQQIQLQGGGPNASRQESAHAHQAIFSPDNARLWIVDLGSDKVWIYDFDAQNGALQPSAPPFVTVKAGAGPRHLAFAGERAYVVSELNNTMTVFDGAATTPRPIQTFSTLPPGFAGTSYAAEIAVAANGRFLYASNRGAEGAPSSIAAFAIGADGKLAPVGWKESSVPTFVAGAGGKLAPAGWIETGAAPRHFALDPSGQWLLAANQSERAITVYAVDAKTGALTLHSKLQGVPGEPTCLVWS